MNNKFVDYINTTHTNVTHTRNYISGTWKGREIDYLITECDTNNCFNLIVFDKKIKRFEGTYIVVYNNDNFHIVKTTDIDNLVCLEHRYEAIMISNKEYEQIRFDDIRDIIRRII